MVYRMTVTLNEAEYAALSTEAARHGKPLESFLHEVLIQHLQPPASERPLNSREIAEFLYREGMIEHIPTGKAENDATEAERKRLASLFGQGKRAFDRVIEDRGPR